IILESSKKCCPIKHGLLGRTTRHGNARHAVPLDVHYGNTLRLAGSTPFPYTTLCRSPAERRAAASPSTRGAGAPENAMSRVANGDRKSTRLNSSHVSISYAVLCLKKTRTKASQKLTQQL